LTGLDFTDNPCRSPAAGVAFGSLLKENPRISQLDIGPFILFGSSGEAGLADALASRAKHNTVSPKSPLPLRLNMGCIDAFKGYGGPVHNRWNCDGNEPDFELANIQLTKHQRTLKLQTEVNTVSIPSHPVLERVINAAIAMGFPPVKMRTGKGSKDDPHADFGAVDIACINAQQAMFVSSVAAESSSYGLKLCHERAQYESPRFTDIQESVYVSEHFWFRAESDQTIFTPTTHTVSNARLVSKSQREIPKALVFTDEERGVPIDFPITGEQVNHGWVSAETMSTATRQINAVLLPGFSTRLPKQNRASEALLFDINVSRSFHIVLFFANHSLSLW
jgi:hypothetical protein